MKRQLSKKKKPVFRKLKISGFWDGTSQKLKPPTRVELFRRDHVNDGTGTLRVQLLTTRARQEVHVAACARLRAELRDQEHLRRLAREDGDVLQMLVDGRR